MAMKAAVREDDSTLSRLDRALYRIEGWFGLLSGFAVFALMLLAVYSVGGRNFFNSPVRGYVDWIEVTMPLIAFMGISYAQRDGGHIRMDILVSRLRGRALWIAEFVSTFLILVVILLLIWRLYEGMQRYIGNGETTLFLQFPVWWGYAASFAAGVVACLTAVYCAVMRIREALADRALLPREHEGH